MCGITGYWQSEPTTTEDLTGNVRRMADTLQHRGPDDEGRWIEAEYGLAFGFRRLAILDLTQDGHQPMTSASGRYVIIFNGEIFNFKRLRSELEALGQSFHSESDTEVMLSAFDAWGPEQAVRRFIGQFAFALWDWQERKLRLVRDRLGIKPMYYGWMADTLLFGSELKALKAHPAFRGEIDRQALALYLRHNYVPTPYSIYRNVRKQVPGTILTFSSSDPADCTEATYWSARQIAEDGARHPFEGDADEALEALEPLLSDAVGLRMIADVPLGAFLSGGVDSSTVVALMQAQADRPVKTFTIGFHESGFDEASHARAVAAHLGTDHTELYVTPDETRQVIPLLPELYDEPFSDSSQIPTFLISQLTRKQVTVSLSGDGGDELFGGYNRYFWGRSIWNQTRLLPAALRRAGARAISAVSPQAWDRGLALIEPAVPARLREPQPGTKLHKLAEVLASDTPEALYHGLVSHWKQPDRVVLQGTEPPTLLTDRSTWAELPEFTQRMMYLDLVTYLPDDILTKLDRASMGVSLEARVPLLDHRVAELAWRLPLSFKIRGATGKWLLRQLLYRHVPERLIERPKMGFGVPIQSWLRDPLRDWAESLLDPRRLSEEGYFDPAPIREKWQEHLSGGHDWHYYLWDVLMFQAWLEAE